MASSNLPKGSASKGEVLINLLVRTHRVHLRKEDEIRTQVLDIPWEDVFRVSFFSYTDP